MRATTRRTVDRSRAARPADELLAGGGDCVGSSRRRRLRLAAESDLRDGPAGMAAVLEGLAEKSALHRPLRVTVSWSPPRRLSCRAGHRRGSQRLHHPVLSGTVEFFVSTALPWTAAGPPEASRRLAAAAPRPACARAPPRVSCQPLDDPCHRPRAGVSASLPRRRRGRHRYSLWRPRLAHPRVCRSRLEQRDGVQVLRRPHSALRPTSRSHPRPAHRTVRA